MESSEFVGAEADVKATTEGASGDGDRAGQPVSIPVIGRIGVLSPIHCQGEVLRLFAADPDRAHCNVPTLGDSRRGGTAPTLGCHVTHRAGAAGFSAALGRSVGDRPPPDANSIRMLVSARLTKS
jgi:hypothetical protein